MKSLVSKLLSLASITVLTASILAPVSASALTEAPVSGKIPTYTAMSSYEMVNTANTYQTVTLKAIVQADPYQSQYLSMPAETEGAVTFYANGQEVTCTPDSYTLTSGGFESGKAGFLYYWSATCDTVFTTADTYTISDSFSGGDNTDPSSSSETNNATITVTDNTVDTITAITDNNSYNDGDGNVYDQTSLRYNPATFTAHVSADGEPVSGGTVTFYTNDANGGVISGCEAVTADSTGTYSCTTDVLASGYHDIEAAYNGVPGSYGTSVDDTYHFVFARPRITMISGADGSVSLGWDAPEDLGVGGCCTVVGYTINVYAGGQLFATVPFTAGDTATTKVVPGLTNGTPFSFTVSAEYDVDEATPYTGPASNPADATPVAPVVTPTPTPTPTPTSTPTSTTTSSASTPAAPAAQLAVAPTQTSGQAIDTSSDEGTVLADSTTTPNTAPAPAKTAPKTVAKTDDTKTSNHKGFPWWIIVLLAVLTLGYYLFSRRGNNA